MRIETVKLEEVSSDDVYNRIPLLMNFRRGARQLPVGDTKVIRFYRHSLHFILSSCLNLSYHCKWPFHCQGLYY